MTTRGLTPWVSNSVAHECRLLGRGVGHEIRPVGGQAPLLYDAATHGAGLAFSHSVLRTRCRRSRAARRSRFRARCVEPRRRMSPSVPHARALMFAPPGTPIRAPSPSSAATTTSASRCCQRSPLAHRVQKATQDLRVCPARKATLELQARPALRARRTTRGTKANLACRVSLARQASRARQDPKGQPALRDPRGQASDTRHLRIFLRCGRTTYRTGSRLRC
jgi:hypothetical protein